MPFSDTKLSNLTLAVSFDSLLDNYATLFYYFYLIFCVFIQQLF